MSQAHFHPVSVMRPPKGAAERRRSVCRLWANELSSQQATFLALMRFFTLLIAGTGIGRIEYRRSRCGA